MPEVAQADIGAVLEALAVTIRARREADPEESYTARLLNGPEDCLLKKVGEESCEVIMAAKDGDHDHVLYESADLVYHLLVTLERYDVALEELAAELAARRDHTNGERTEKGEALRVEGLEKEETS